MKILNLTQHRASPEQISDGVFDVEEIDRTRLSELLTFDEIPTAQEMRSRIMSLIELVMTYDSEGVMIGGAPFLMAQLEDSLLVCGKRVFYAFSKRESVEGPDGRKSSVFRHLGFYATRGYNSG